MSRTKDLASRLREVVLNGRWIANNNYRDQLMQINLQQATKKIGALNSIAALTFHINYYLEGLIKVMEEGKLEMSDQFSFDLAPLLTESDWEKLRNSLFMNAEKFAALIEQMSEAQLDSPFVDAKYGTWLRNLEGVIEHSYYHLGQVSLIRKLSGS